MSLNRSDQQPQDIIKKLTRSATALTSTVIISINLSSPSLAEAPPIDIATADSSLVTETLSPVQVSPAGVAKIGKEIEQPFEGSDSSDPDNEVSLIPAETDPLEHICMTSYPPFVLPM